MAELKKIANTRVSYNTKNDDHSLYSGGSKPQLLKFASLPHRINPLCTDIHTPHTCIYEYNDKSYVLIKRILYLLSLVGFYWIAF